MRGLAGVLRKVEDADLVAARDLADELDRAVGGHIQFEEEILYPAVGQVRGSDFERELCQEHGLIRRAIKRLLEADLSSEDSAGLRTELQGALKVAVEHAESCGTLISHLRALSPPEQREALSRLNQLRERGTRWTELPS